MPLNEAGIGLLVGEAIGVDGFAVVVQAQDRLPSYEWIEIDGQDGLGGGVRYGGFNYVVEGFAHDPTTNEVQPDLLRTKCGKILYISDIANALLSREVEINLLPTSEVTQLITGRSLREVRLQKEREGRPAEVVLAELRSNRHCGTCAFADCYCIRR